MGDLLNPFGALASVAGKVVADAWTAAMLGLWNAGLWILRLAFTFTDLLLTPDLAEDGAGATLYRTTFWIAGSLMLVMGLVQLGVASFRRDGKSLARVAIGFGQFVVVWAGWLAYAVTVVVAAGGLTRALMSSLPRCVCCGARPPSAFAARELATAWQEAAAITDLTGLQLWVGGSGHPAFAVGPHHLVLAQTLVDRFRAGRLTRDDIVRLILHADGRRRRGYPRFDLLLAFWTWTWDLLRGGLLGVGRLLRWIPLVGFAWRVRFVVTAVAVVQETLAGRPGLAAIIGAFIALTYLTPACRRAWERHLDDVDVTSWVSHAPAAPRSG